jgi:predicted naringenin-chalcone synthase
MGCAGAIIGLREALALLRSREQSVVALLSVELSSLHFQETLELGVLTTQALFGDAAAALLLSSHPRARGPQLVDTHCVTDFAALDQMRWTIGDDGFVMGLSTRVPVTVGRNIGPAVQQLLTPHGLAVEDIAHWLVHPGGPSVLEAVQKKLGLSDEMIAPAWDTLRDHGNCSSATVLLMLDRLLRSGEARRGEWGVIMAFGPGLTLETALLRF